MSQFLSQEKQEKIVEIKEASNIVQVISEYVVLKNAGKNYIGLCPFHNEKTPSFSVNPEKQFYKCFGCGENGDVFTFLMKHNGMKFPESLLFLAERAGITLPAKFSNGQDEDVKNPLYKVNSYFAEFYSKKLMSSGIAKTVKKYVEDRGINENFIKKFQIGYSHPSWNALIIEANAQKIETEALEQVGLILQKKSGVGFYDRFRDRLMFPICDEFGNVVGFGARTLENESSQPKYINSPESKIFSKRRILYGLNFAKNSILKRREIILMEGYTDVIIAHQYGIDWAVGVMGTSLTSEHVKLVKKYCNNVVLVLDSDAAGLKSADRSADLFIENGLDVKIVQLPEEYDPCDFIISKGKDSFLGKIKEASDFYDFKLRIARLNGNLTTVSDKAKVFHEIILTAMRTPDIIKRNIQIKEIAGKIGIDETELKNYLANFNKKGSGASRSGYVTADLPKNEHQNSHKRMDSYVLRKRNASYNVEMELARLMIFDNKFITVVKEGIGIENFLDTGLRSIVECIFKTYSKNGNIDGAMLFSFFAESELHKTLADIVSIEPLPENFENIFNGCKQFINKRKSRYEIQKTKEAYTIDLKNKMKDENGSESEEKLNMLLDKFHKENKRFQFHKEDKRNLRKMTIEKNPSIDNSKQLLR